MRRDAEGAQGHDGQQAEAVDHLPGPVFIKLHSAAHARQGFAIERFRKTWLVQARGGRPLTNLVEAEREVLRPSARRGRVLVEVHAGAGDGFHCVWKCVSVRECGSGVVPWPVLRTNIAHAASIMHTHPACSLSTGR
jgi:hypothetical protein